MERISEKYMAGFFDADGHFSVRARIGAKPDLEASIAQRAPYRFILESIQEEFGGVIRDKVVGEKTYHELQMRGTHARKCFDRLHKYLVLKKDHVQLMRELVDAAFTLNTPEDVKKVRDRVKEIRGYGATQQPNFPSRKWLAGYFDGDGCFSVKVCKKTNGAYPTASILAAKNYVVGIHLLQKAFGGRLCVIKDNALWQLQLSQPSKINEFVSFFAKHLIIKQAQAYFLLGCATGGNLRDGENIRKAFIHLNSQQHRLSDPTSVAAGLVKEVNFSLPTRWEMKRQSKLHDM